MHTNAHTLPACMKIVNKKARFDFHISETFEAGVVLLGSEVKSLRGGHASLDGAHIRIRAGQAYLVNATISPYAHARNESYDPKRTRKLLLHRRELISLEQRLKQARLTLIPIAWYNKGPHFKLEIALARGKKQHDKKEAKKRKDIEREVERDYRQKVK